ncbi:hypothetical protein [Oceanicoccus sagamiensis]|uniref:hypothetical protein n=1 Tax=Oceanicoccus sagamiensis TaxID=716816 RepID=UPI000A26BE56|nr:hypothetical protein [Oceanicoccus sagamiensis]
MVLLWVPCSGYAGLDAVLDNGRVALDGAIRGMENLESHEHGMIYYLGLDLHKVFSRSTSDIGTLIFQPYLVRRKNTHYIFSDVGQEDDQELIWRVANFNYTALSNGGVNIRAGHFELPFGLEQTMDSNGTLRQFTASDRAIKSDWGVSVNGVLPSYEYEVALSAGSGNTIDRSQSPYLFSGRIGSASHQNYVVGGSWFYGDVLVEKTITERRKIGLDLAYYFRQWMWLAEISIGENDQQNTVSGFLELSQQIPQEHLHLYMQLKHQQIKSEGWQSGGQFITGLVWEPYKNFTVSGQLLYSIEEIEQQPRSNRLSVQLRYRFE